MPYRDPERRRQAARKWRVVHRAERAAYMRRYRKARSSGRPPGRPRARETTQGPLPVLRERAGSPRTGLSTVVADALPVTEQLSSALPSSAEAAPRAPPEVRPELPPSPSAGVGWEGPFPDDGS